MKDLTEHYAILLDLDAAWEVAEVDLKLEEKRVEIQLKSVKGHKHLCPGCDQPRSLKDHAPERRWRHLDTMQFETILVAQVPRTRCPGCGVKTCSVPWADPHGQFTLMFEAFAIEVLLAAANVKRACVLLGLDWHAGQAIMDRAVQRGQASRDLDEVKHLGVDEKSFRRGQSYITVMTDLGGRRVVEVVEGRTKKAADKLFDVFSDDQKDNIEAVAMDMWKAFENSVEANLPRAEIVHDRFHIMAKMNAAVDQVRRAENKALRKEDDKTLAGTKYLWLENPENQSPERAERFAALKAAGLKTARAWHWREMLREFWDCGSRENAEAYFKRWRASACRSRLKPVIAVGRMIGERLDRVLSWFDHRISNGAAEGYNSKIQSLKSAARGFRNFANYRTRVLFFCGRMNLKPAGLCH